jgi:hypothetical protein
VGVELFHTSKRTDGRFDMMKLIISSRNCFAKMYKTNKYIKKLWQSFREEAFFGVLTLFQHQWSCDVE